MSELELLLRVALNRKTCLTEKPRIEAGWVVIPFDGHHPTRQPEWTIEYERVQTRTQLLDALGYG
jgi:hypothetical protein